MANINLADTRYSMLVVFSERMDKKNIIHLHKLLNAHLSVIQPGIGFTKHKEKHQLVASHTHTPTGIEPMT